MSLIHGVDSNKNIRRILVDSLGRLVAVLTLGAGTPILELDSYSGVDLAYQTLVSWTVGAGKTGVLNELAFTRDANGKADYRVTIGAVVITDFNPKAHVSLPFQPNQLVAGTVVSIEVKSSDGTAIAVDGSVTGDEE